MYLSKKAVLEWLNDLAEKFPVEDARRDVVFKIHDWIFLDRFDADQTEIQRLRAIEQAIRDFTPTKEQQAGYDALVAWLESTTPFRLEGNHS